MSSVATGGSPDKGRDAKHGCVLAGTVVEEVICIGTTPPKEDDAAVLADDEDAFGLLLLSSALEVSSQ